MRCPRLLIPQIAQRALAFGPAFSDLDVDVEEYRFFEQLYDVLTRLRGNALHVRAACSKQNGSVAFPLHDHASCDARPGIVLFPLLDDDRTAVGKFVSNETKNLLANQLGHDTAHGT